MTTNLKQALEKLLFLIRKFPPGQRNVKHFSDWNLYDVIKHINGWNIERISELEDLRKGVTVDRIDDFDRFNRYTLSQKRYYSFDQLIDELERSSSDLVSAFRAIPESMMNQPIWSGSSMTVEKWLEIDYMHIRNEHIVEIERVLREIGEE